MNRVLVIAITVFAFAFAASAFAATSGSYSGSSTFTVVGQKVVKGFGLTVKQGKVVKVRFLATSVCGDLDATMGVKVKFAIKHNKFSGTFKNGRGDAVKFQGTFKGKTVKGTWSGTFKSTAESCPLLNNRFSAKLG